MPCPPTKPVLMDARPAKPPTGMTLPDPTQSSVDALHHLLDEAQAYAPEQHQGLSNHLPMALSALHGLGASPARMRAFFDRHVLVLEAGDQPDSPATPVDDWLSWRGRTEAFAALRAHFHAALAWEGRDAVLHQALPRLMEAPAAASFHGLIRTAHAIESEHAAELASGLAFWATRWVALPPAVASGRSRFAGVQPWLEALHQHSERHHPGWRASSRLIVDAMREASGTAAYRALADPRWAPPHDGGDLLQELSQVAAAHYAGTADFTLGHVATAARAARVVAPWLTPSGRLPVSVHASLWRAVAAACLSVGLRPRLSTGPSSSTAVAMGACAVDAASRPERASDHPDRSIALDQASLRARAIASDDAHTIKFAHAMLTQHAQAPHAVWLHAAAVAVGG